MQRFLNKLCIYSLNQSSQLVSGVLISRHTNPIRFLNEPNTLYETPGDLGVQWLCVFHWFHWSGIAGLPKPELPPLTTRDKSLEMKHPCTSRRPYAYHDEKFWLRNRHYHKRRGAFKVLPSPFSIARSWCQLCAAIITLSLCTSKWQ